MKQIVSKQIVEKKNRREGRGRVLSLSRQIYKLSGKSTYYVESETCDNRYYFVRYNPSFEWCSCKDFESNRAERCKHLYAVEFAIRFNTIKEIDRLPAEVLKVKRDLIAADKYKNESIRTLNDLEKTETEQQEAVAYRRTNQLSYEEDSYSF